MISIAAGAALVSLVDYRLLLIVVTAGTLTSALYLWPARRLTSVRPPEITPSTMRCRSFDGP